MHQKSHTKLLRTDGDPPRQRILQFLQVEVRRMVSPSRRCKQSPVRTVFTMFYHQHLQGGHLAGFAPAHYYPGPPDRTPRKKVQAVLHRSFCRPHYPGSSCWSRKHPEWKSEEHVGKAYKSTKSNHRRCRISKNNQRPNQGVCRRLSHFV